MAEEGSGDDTPEEQEGRNLFGGISETVESFRQGGILGEGEEEQEVEQEAEEAEEQGEVVPELLIDRSRFEFSLPQNREEAEARVDLEGITKNISDHVLESYLNGQVDDPTRLLRDWSTNEKTVLKEVREAREELRSRVSTLQESLEFEDREEGYQGNWTMRLERVLQYLEFLNQNIQPAEEFGPGVAKDMYLGSGKFELPDTASNPLASQEGLEYTEFDAVEVPQGYTRTATYGMAHALEDVKKINRNHLDTLVESEEAALNRKYNALQGLDDVLRRVEKSFWDLMKVRLNLEALEGKEGIEEEIAREAEVNEWGEELRQTLIVEEEEGVHELQVRAADLEKEEARVVQLFEEAHEILQQNFRIDEYSVEELDRAGEEILATHEPQQLFLEFVNQLSGGTPGLESKIRELAEEFGRLEENVERLREIEYTDVRDIMIAERKMELVLEEMRNNYEFEEILEDEEDELIADEEEAELRMEEIVNDAVRDVEQIVNRYFEDEPVKEFRLTIKELQEAGKRLSKHEKLEEKDLKEEEAIEELLEDADTALTEMEENLAMKGPWDEATVEVEFQGEAVEGHPEEVMEQILKEVVSVDEHLSEEIQREGDEEDNVLKAIRELEDALERAERLAEAVRDMNAVKTDMDERLSDLPGKRLEEGRKMFWAEVNMIEGRAGEGSEDELSKMMSVIQGEKFQKLISDAGDLLEQNTSEERKELEMLSEISRIEEDLENKVGVFKNEIRNQDRVGPDSEIVSTLKNLVEKMEDVEEHTERLETGVEEELEGETEAEDDFDAFEEDWGDDDLFG